MARSSPATLSPSSASSSSSEDSPKHFDSCLVGTHKLHYLPRQQWDFIADSEDQPIDLSLIIPHYRAHNQPTGYRMSMHIHSERSEIKATVCRKSPRSPFLLYVHSSSTAPVTLYLPSDFSGSVRAPAHTSFSAGFTNHILPRVGGAGGDALEVCAAGPVTLRMWDVCAGAPERPAREAWRKMCRRGASARSLPQPAIDWDFLLED
ncbi:hypothetical protein BV25DRAFT_1829444 [Artomyces pyxidatus]|uniref:Uncharacterized protein n=1 Tax=Artomyces pyxidatus TaxID=48021 RepID=A0ACB8SRA9_9AGAM|nr:hypothetical protein BV25DRAFT_1829444 [Artomyces pyxidatus]